MPVSPTYASSWTFYAIGFLFIAIGIAFVLVPLLANDGVLSNAKVPWIILYVYNKGGFYFATSPILIILSLVVLVVLLLRR